MKALLPILPSISVMNSMFSQFRFFINPKGLLNMSFCFEPITFGLLSCMINKLTDKDQLLLLKKHVTSP